MNRRQLLMGTAAGLVAAGASRVASAGNMVMPWEYITKKDMIKNTDGTPLQFMPKSFPNRDLERRTELLPGGINNEDE